jgi:hypothetical protein
VESEKELHRHRRPGFCPGHRGRGTDQFELIPDSDEEGGDNGPSLLDGDDEFVPETEPQDIIAVSSIGGPCKKQGRLG